MAGLPDFRFHLKSGPFTTPPLFNHSRSRLGQISDTFKFFNTGNRNDLSAEGGTVHEWRHKEHKARHLGDWDSENGKICVTSFTNGPLIQNKFRQQSWCRHLRPVQPFSFRWQKFPTFWRSVLSRRLWGTRRFYFWRATQRRRTRFHRPHQSWLFWLPRPANLYFRQTKWVMSLS